MDQKSTEEIEIIKSKRNVKHSQPIYVKEVTLNSDPAQKLFDRVFLRVSDSLYRIDWILRIVGDESKAEEFKEAIGEDITDTATLFQNELERVNLVLENSGIIEMPRYTKQRRFRYQITTPQSSQLMSLIEMADKIDEVMAALWLCGAIKSQYRLNEQFMVRKRIYKVGFKVMQIERMIRSLAKKTGQSDAVKSAREASQKIVDERQLDTNENLENEEAKAA